MTGSTGQGSANSSQQATGHVPAGGATAMPGVNAMTADDLRACLALGWADFKAAPQFGLFFGAIYAVGGLLIVQSLLVWNMSWLIYPLMIGFPLIGPFAAVGLYEVSRRRIAGEPLEWSGILGIVRQQSKRELSWMAFVMLFVFWVWMYQVRLLIALVLGRMSFGGLDGFLEVVFTTPQGWLFLALGHIIGAGLSLVMFSLTVTSIPMLMERKIDFVTAMVTSVRTVLASPVMMIGWGIIVTLAVIAAMVPAFLGLLVVLPVLGHTTWHIYKRAIEPA